MYLLIDPVTLHQWILDLYSPEKKRPKKLFKDDVTNGTTTVARRRRKCVVPEHTNVGPWSWVGAFPPLIFCACRPDVVTTMRTIADLQSCNPNTIAQHQLKWFWRDTALGMSNFTRQPWRLKLTIQAHIVALGEHTYNPYVRPTGPLWSHNTTLLTFTNLLDDFVGVGFTNNTQLHYGAYMGAKQKSVTLGTHFKGMWNSRTVNITVV